MMPRASVAFVAALSVGCAGLTDPDAPAYRKLDAELGPSARWGHTLVYDGARDRLLTFGGEGPGGKLSDVWAFSLETEEWSELSTSDGPAARVSAAVLLDAPRDRLIVAGGSYGPSDTSTETWALDLASLTWSLLPDVPTGVSAAAVANDSTRAWLHGGLFPAGSATSQLLELDLESDTWSVRTDTGPRPAARAYGVIAKRNDHLVIALGNDNDNNGDANSVPGDVWEYGLSTLHWYELDARRAPIAGTGHAYAWDAACEALLLTGGDDNDDYDVGVTTALVLRSLPRFELLPASNTLPPRRRAASAVDPVRRKLVVLGGLQGYGDTLNDTWLLPLGDCL